MAGQSRPSTSYLLRVLKDVDARHRRQVYAVCAGLTALAGHDARKESGTTKVFLMLTETTDYDTLYRDFRWEIPARFNIATACCDRHADGTDRLALIYVDEDGGAQRTSFDDIGEMSRRFAN